MRVKCRTNLDLDHEEWPDRLHAVPRVGDSIQSAVNHNGFQLRLEVRNITWKFDPRQQTSGADGWYPEIELHMGDSYLFKKYNKKGELVSFSITDFYEWYAPKVGRSVGAFL